jgi:hypothetical protein
MTLATQLLSDLAAAFFNSDEFAVSAALTSGGTTRTIAVIFDAPTRVIDPVTGIAVEIRDYSCLAIATDVAAVIHGDTIVINGVTYAITGVEPDGTGVTTLILRTA